DQLRRVGTGELPVAESDQRIPPHRPADGEAMIARDARAGAEPLVDAGCARAPTEHDARDAVPSAAARLLRDPPAVGGVVEPLDLPDVGLDAGLLEGRDR